MCGHTGRDTTMIRVWWEIDILDYNNSYYYNLLPSDLFFHLDLPTTLAKKLNTVENLFAPYKNATKPTCFTAISSCTECPQNDSEFEKLNNETRTVIEMHRLLHYTWGNSKFLVWIWKLVMKFANKWCCSRSARTV